MQKKIFTPLLYLSFIICCLFGLTSIKASASVDNYGNKEYNSKKYYGEILDMRNINSFSMIINQNSFIKDEPFLEFINTPYNVGNRSEYTPDYEKLIITLTDCKQKSNQLKIQLSPRKDGGSHTICISAKGGKQNYLGEYFATKTDQGDELSSEFPAMIPYTFDGYVRDQRYIDKQGKKIKAANNGKISLYYDAMENSLYTDMGLSNVKSFQNISDKEGINDNRWKIRNFSKKDYLIKKSNGQKVPCLDSEWNGFTEGADIEVTFSIENVVLGKKPSLMLLSLGGQPLYKSINVESPSKAIKGATYLPPVPEFYNYDELINLDFTNGKYKVLSPSNNEIVPLTYFSEVKPFDTNEVGEYKIYYQKDGKENVLIIECLPEDTKGSEIIPVTQFGSFYQGGKVNVGATVINSLQKNEPKVNLIVKHNGVEKDIINNISSDYYYNFSEYGVYELNYFSTDYVGRITEKTISLNVDRYFPVFKEDIYEGQCFQSGLEVHISKDDLKVYDIPLQDYFIPSDFVITVSFNGGNYIPLNETDFIKEGKYEVKYKAKYSSDQIYNVEVNRTFYVYNTQYVFLDINPKSSVQPLNTELLAFDDSVIEYKAVKGKTVYFPYNYVKLQGKGNITVQLIYEKDVKDITSQFISGTYGLFLENIGEYEIIIKASNGNYSSSKLIKINVKSKWLKAEATLDLKLNIGDEIPDLYPVIKDFYGNKMANEITDIVIMYNGNEIPLNEFKINNLGIYKVMFTSSIEGETLTGSYNIIGIDNEKPKVSLKKHKDTVFINKFVAVAEIDVLDNSGLNCSSEIEVLKDGKNILVYNNGFKADEYGDYIVKYYVKDAVGNLFVKEYTITVKSYTGLIIGVVVGCIILTAISISFVMISKKKKRGVK